MEITATYPTVHEKLLERMNRLSEAAPETMSGFGALHEAATADGALKKSVKELIALAIAITVRCDGCIAFHVAAALESGASREEIIDAIGVAVLMGGGPSVVYGSEALEALEQISASAD